MKIPLAIFITFCVILETVVGEGGGQSGGKKEIGSPDGKKLKKVILKKRPSNSTQHFANLRHRLLGNSSTTMATLVIPIPESQRKPYQPMILQMSNSTKKMNTYKLSKMFVPTGIVGHVLNQSSNAKAKSLLTDDRIDASQISLTTSKPEISKISLTTSIPGQNVKAIMPPPDPFQMKSEEMMKYGPSSGGHGLKNLIEKLRPQVSIADVIEKGLSMVTKAASNGFGSSSEYKTTKVRPGNIIASVPGGNIMEDSEKSESSSYEVLEYFRQRPWAIPAWHSFMFPEDDPNASLVHTNFFQDNTRIRSHDNRKLSKAFAVLRGRYGEGDLIRAREAVYGVFLGTRSARAYSNSRVFNDVMEFYAGLYEIANKGSHKSLGSFYHEGDNGGNSASSSSKSEESNSSWKPVSYAVRQSHKNNQHKQGKKINGNLKQNNGFHSHSQKSKSNNVINNLSSITGNFNNHFDSLRPIMSKPQKPNRHSHSHTKNVQQFSSPPRKVVPPPTAEDDVVRLDDDYELVPKDTYLKNKNFYGEALDTVVLRNPTASPAAQYFNQGKLNQALVLNAQKAKAYKNKEDTFVWKPAKITYPKKITTTSTTPKPTTTTVAIDLEELLADTIPANKNRRIIEDTPQSMPPQTYRQPFQHLYSNLYTNLLGSTKKPVPKKPSIPTTKFFAPIPISDKVIKETLRGRYASPVPRYVVELAKKLKKDKDVQGIVRVRINEGRGGKAVEYLYPVRG